MDGLFSRMLLYLRCHDDNGPERTLPEFTQATREYGVPSHVTSDKGSKKLFIICKLSCFRIGMPMHNSIVCQSLVVILHLFYYKTSNLFIQIGGQDWGIAWLMIDHLKRGTERGSMLDVGCQ